MSALDWITAAAAVAAAGASILTYWRLRRQDESVGWRLEPVPLGTFSCARATALLTTSTSSSMTLRWR